MSNNCRSRCWHDQCCEPYANSWETMEQAQEQAQLQKQAQLQAQLQAQAQLQGQDQDSKTIIKDIGNSNVTVTVDNENILVAVLVLVDSILGGVADTSALRAYLEQRKSEKIPNA
ncbi:MAG TPA: hypothetical protein PKB13_12505 [Clostridia bacterium]|nr:hypothetical protein [Clostridia bacterium]